MGKIPVTLNRDEAAIGYNAFTISKFGMDEWGVRFPIIFKSFGDYKLPGYIYFLAGLIKIFGISDLVIRLPSLFAGIAIISLSYLIMLRFTGSKKLAIIAAAMMTIQPWAIFYSRMAFEANLGLALLLSAIFLTSNNSRYKFIFGIICYLLAIFTYNAPLLLIPLFLVLVIIRGDLAFRTKVIMWLGLIMVAIIGSLLLSKVSVQKQAITIFSDPTLHDIWAKNYAKSNSIEQKIWWNKYVFWGREMMSRLINSGSPKFLVISGGQNPWHSVGGTGHVFYTTYLLALIGFFRLLTSKNIEMRNKLVVIILIIGSLLPSIITVDAPHATRSLFFLWLVTCLAAEPLNYLFKKRLLGSILIIGCLILESLNYSRKYLIEFPQMRSIAWPIGYKEALIKSKQNYPNTEMVQVIGEGDLAADQLYIYPLLYWQVSPNEYLNSVKLMPNDNANMIRVVGFDRWSVLPIRDTINSNASLIIKRKVDGSFEYEK